MQSDDKFSLRSRIFTALLGLMTFLGGIAYSYLPPDKFSVERDGRWKVVKASFESTDTTLLSAVLAVGGLVLVLYAINGYKLIRFAAGSFSAEAEHAKDLAQNFYRLGADVADSKQVETAREAPQPTEPAVGTVKENGEELAVYELKDVPLSVISDAITAWPNEDGAPRSTADFEFATRKKGKGNHPWTIKFQGKPAITVSYGGQGKAGATVGPGV
ncbi:TPA: hypothetical protein ACKP5X_001644 [Stenotrophomonas maltophilia]